MLRAFKKRLYTGFALAILLSVASGLTSYLILQKQKKQRVWVRQARNILDTAGSIQSQVMEMGNSRTDFSATNQKQFLEPYYRGLKRIAPAIGKLRDLIADDKEVMNIEISLELHISELLNFWKLNGDDASKYTKEYIAKLTDNEKIKIDEIRGLITDLQKNETKLLNKRREDYDQLIHYGTLSTILESIISLATIIILVYVIILEFNSRWKVQEQLHASVAQLKDQTQMHQKSETELKNTMDELATINKQLEQFAYTVAHDIKSPLYGIISALDIIRDEEAIAKDANLSNFVDISANAALHLSDMVDFLLEYSRVSLDHQAPELVHIKELLEQLTVLLFVPANIHIHIPGEMPVFYTRKLKIMQVFQNLISNAIKYNDKETGQIEIGYVDKRDFYQFCVKDNGQGIPEEFKDKIFSLTKTAGNKTKIDSSTGFGLNIAKLIVEEQGGKIWFDSVNGQGTIFYFEWKKPSADIFQPPNN